MKKAPHLTPEQFRDRLDYDPETGLFRWRTSRFGSPVKAGAIAGMQHNTGHWRLVIDRKHYPCHLIAWYLVHGEWCPGEIDHINRCKTDNRIANLRRATFSQNSANKPTRPNKYGFPGISRRSEHGNYFARIVVQGRKIHLGMYPTAEAAAEAYKKAARQHFGEFSPV